MGFNSAHKALKLKAMDQLFQGHELATQLQQLISQSGSNQGLAEDLVKKILGSFDNTISALDSFESMSSTSSLAAFEGSQNASCDNDGKFEDSGDSRKRLGPPVKGKRGCYKRKKRAETWTVESTIPEDAFSWRKYGQKEILNAIYPRSYFRCTHKYTQGCKATKQVQKVDLEPRLFSITYIGNHTCDTNEDTPNIKKPCDHHDEIIMDSQGLKTPSLTTSMKEKAQDSMEKDLSLVWPDMIFEDHHHETSGSINVLCSTDLMVFEAGNDFGFSDNEQLSIFD